MSGLLSEGNKEVIKYMQNEGLNAKWGNER